LERKKVKKRIDEETLKNIEKKQTRHKIYKRIKILMKNYFVVAKQISRKKIQYPKIEFNI
jgi:hypothetical protein